MPSKSKRSPKNPNNVNRLIMRGKYDEAISLAKKELRRLSRLKFENFEDWEWGVEHWYLTQMSSAYHEKREYKKAIKLVEKSLEMYPECPMSLWHYAGPLSMLKRYDEAIEIYKGLLKRNLATGLCTEGKEEGAGMKSDCRYEISLCYGAKKDYKNALKWARLAKRYYSPFGNQKEKTINSWLLKLEKSM